MRNQRHTNQKLLRRIGAVVGILFGAFWLWFGLAESFSATGVGIRGITEGITVGVIIIALTLLSLRAELVGGSLLVILSGYVLIVGFLRHGSPLGVLFVSLPPVTTGFLFLLSWWSRKH